MANTRFTVPISLDIFHPPCRVCAVTPLSPMGFTSSTTISSLQCVSVRRFSPGELTRFTVYAVAWSQLISRPVHYCFRFGSRAPSDGTYCACASARIRERANARAPPWLTVTKQSYINYSLAHTRLPRLCASFSIKLPYRGYNVDKDDSSVSFFFSFLHRFFFCSHTFEQRVRARDSRQICT